MEERLAAAEDEGKSVGMSKRGMGSYPEWSQQAHTPLSLYMATKQERPTVGG